MKLLKKMIISLILILGISLNIFSQTVVEVDGEKYMDGKTYNKCVDTYQECRDLLVESNDQLKKIKSENEVMLETLETVQNNIDDMQKKSTKSKIKLFFTGTAAGSIITTIILVILF